ncbi:hypothetical protein QVD17_17853 [Tagetes erecta]|uniref:Uncharacterized protein n=1 Tax=Tagetes erecta TaxID=13708 RepID=A0AAD8KGQ0_TARER|nr:hypothetical protein QVD17_17853 [Tagetes erecta]
MAEKYNSSCDDRLKDAVVQIDFSTENNDDGGWSSQSSAMSVNSLRDLAESMMRRRQVAELEMMKRREALRIEAQNRRLEKEAQLTEMMLNTQLQLTSFICSQTSHRKRKCPGEDDATESLERKGAMLLSLLHFNFGI